MPSYWTAARLRLPMILDAPQSKAPRIRLFAIAAIIFLTAVGVRLLYCQDNHADLLRARKGENLQMMAPAYYDHARLIIENGSPFAARASGVSGDATMLVHPPGYSVLIIAVARLFHEQ